MKSDLFTVFRVACSGFLLTGILFCYQKQFGERDPAYRLQAGDTIKVEYRYSPEYDGEPTVQPDGEVSLQLVGGVKVSGLTLAEAAAAIKEKAGQRLNDPEVSILLKDFVHPYYVVAGEVDHPGRFEMHGTVTALEAIAVSGGFKDSAKHSHVILVRKYNAEYAQVSVLNLKEMMTAEKVSENPALRPGDMLIVPQNISSKMEKYIRWTSMSLYGIAVVR